MDNNLYKEGFYVYLFSSDSLQYYESNTLSQFSNKLPRYLNLKNYLVALCDIYIPPMEGSNKQRRRRNELIDTRNNIDNDMDNIEIDDTDVEIDYKRSRREQEQSEEKAVKFSVDNSDLEIKLTQQAFLKIAYRNYHLNFGNGFLAKIKNFVFYKQKPEEKVPDTEKEKFLNYIKLDLIEWLLTNDLQKIPYKTTVFAENHPIIHIYLKSNDSINVTTEYKTYGSARNVLQDIIEQIPLQRRNAQNFVDLVNSDLHTGFDIERIDSGKLKEQFDKKLPKDELMAWMQKELQGEHDNKKDDKKEENTKDKSTVDATSQHIVINFKEYGGFADIDTSKITDKNKVYEIDEFVDLVRKNLTFYGNPKASCEPYSRAELLNLKEKIRQAILSSVNINNYDESPEYKAMVKNEFDLMLNLPHNFTESAVLEREFDGTLKNPLDTYVIKDRYVRKPTVIRPNVYKSFESFIEQPIMQIENGQRNKETFSDALKLVFERFRREDDDARIRRQNDNDQQQQQQQEEVQPLALQQPSGSNTDGKGNKKLPEQEDEASESPDIQKTIDLYKDWVKNDMSWNEYYHYTKTIEEEKAKREKINKMHEKQEEDHMAIKKAVHARQFPKKIVTHGHLASDGILDYKSVTNQIFVYCSIVKPTIVGSQELKLLKIIAHQLEPTGGKYIAYGTRQFVPVHITNFNTIEILLLNSKGEKIHFRDANLANATELPTFLKLHFKPRKEY